jgi:hypothetical protein
MSRLSESYNIILNTVLIFSKYHIELILLALKTKDNIHEKYKFYVYENMLLI